MYLLDSPGKIIAVALAKEGYIVYGTSRKKTEDFEKIKMLTLDIAENESVHPPRNQIIAEQSHIDVLINNADMGISGALELATDEEIPLQMNTNFIGVIRMCNAVLPYAKRTKG